MTKRELEKATGQELIEQRNYCGVDGYYGDCLNDVNAEMLKRFNRLAELEKKNAELEEQVSAMSKALVLNTSENDKQLAKARDLILNLYNADRDVLMCRNEELAYTRLDNAINDKRIEQFLKEIEE